ncbi:MAG: hypothetical protein AB7O97_07140 [Planctomycetota bacterium]
MAHVRWVLVLVAAALTGCRSDAVVGDDRAVATDRAREPVVGLPCEGCEAIFDGLPRPLPAIPSEVRLASAREPGEALCIDGTVRRPDGRPAPGVVVYAYHTDARGVYPPDERLRGTAAFRHGRLRGWARTDADGRYAFVTIRPAGYPGTNTPQHVHMHVLEPGRCTYYVDDVLFTDDARLVPAVRQQLESGRGGSGVVTPVRGADGVWRARRDIRLGEGVPGYPARRD